MPLRKEISEKAIQICLNYKFGSREIRMPNVYVFGDNESDFLTVTKADYVDEYEIKISRADFLADRKKPRHERYANMPTHRTYERPDGTTVQMGGLSYPNRFWYVVPRDMISVDEVPEYAGLLYFDVEQFRVVEVKKAPSLHKIKAGPHVVRKILRAGYYRFLQRWVDDYYV